MEYLENLRRKLPDKTVSMEKTAYYMAQVRVNVARQRQEALQREQRRKMLIAEEVARNEERERTDRENVIKSIGTDSSPATTEFDEKI